MIIASVVSQLNGISVDSFTSQTNAELIAAQQFLSQTKTFNASYGGEFKNEFKKDNTLCTIWYHLCKLKNVKNTHGLVLLLVNLQVSACKFNKSNSSMVVFHVF